MTSWLSTLDQFGRPRPSWPSARIGAKRSALSLGSGLPTPARSVWAALDSASRRRLRAGASAVWPARPGVHRLDERVRLPRADVAVARHRR